MLTAASMRVARSQFDHEEAAAAAGAAATRPAGPSPTGGNGGPAHPITPVSTTKRGAVAFDPAQHAWPSLELREDQ